MPYSITDDVIYIYNEPSTVTLDDIVANAPAAAFKTADRTYYLNRNLAIGWGGMTVEFKAASVTIDTKNQTNALQLDPTASLQIGDIDVNGYTFDGVSLTLLNCSTNVFSDDGDAGDFRAYGSRLVCKPDSSNSTFVFWRLYRDATQVVDLIDCAVDGFSGTGRMQGLTLRNTSFSNCTFGTAGPLTVKSPTVGIDGVRVTKSSQFFYWAGTQSGDITVRNLFERDNDSSKFAIAGRNGSVATFIDPDFENEVLSFNTGVGLPTDTLMNIYEYYSFNATVLLDSDASAISGARLGFYRQDGYEEFNEASDGSGVYPEALLLKQFYKSATPTLTTPHVARLRKLGMIYIEQPVTANSPTISGFRLKPNPKVINASAYAGVTFNFATKAITLSADRTHQEVFDAYQYALQLSANMQYAEEIEVIGTNLNLVDWDMTLNNCTYTGDAVTTGLITLNNATFNGTRTDANGTVGEIILLGISFSNLIAGSQVKIYEAGTTTIIDSVESSTTSFGWNEVYTSNRSVDYTIINEGYLPVRASQVGLGASISSVQAQQSSDRAYNASSGLTFGTTLVIDAVAKTIAVSTATTVQNLYAACIESWRDESALENVRFPIVTNGPNSFTFTDDWEVTSGSVSYLSRDGMRFLDASGNLTASWCAILSSGNDTGPAVDIQQVLGAGPTDAINTGNIDQLIKIYGDATHGNFDYRNYLVLKSRANGFYEAAADVVAQYGTLEDQLYNVVLLPEAISGFDLGDPSVTGLSITDHGASPVSWNGKTYSITITDTGGNTAANIQRWVNYNKSLDATFEGFVPFNLFDMVGAGVTRRGTIIDSAGATLKGVRVVNGSGDAHPLITSFISDDGTAYTPPKQIILSAPNLEAGRVFLYNVTTDTTIDNSLVTGGYTYNWANNTDFSGGDTILFVWASDLGDKDPIVRYGQAPEEGSVSFIDSPVDDQVFLAYTTELGIGGVDITEFIPDFPNLQIDISAGTTFSVTRLYIFYKYILSSEVGIQVLIDAINPIDAGTLVIDVNKVDFRLDSLVAANVTQSDKKVLKRSDGLPVPIAQPTGGYGISMYHDGSPVVFSTSEGLSATDRALLDSIANTQYDTAALHSDLDTYTNKDDWKGDASGGGGGLDESGLHTALDNYSNKNDFKADVSSLATSAEVGAIDTSVDLSAIAKTAELAPLATSAEVAAIDTSVDLTGIATTADVNAAAVDISGLATSAEVQALDFSTDLTGVATSAELAPLATSAEVAALDFSADLTGIARTTDLDDLATTADVTSAVATIDLSGLALTTDVEALDAGITAEQATWLSEIHAFTGLDIDNPVLVTESGSTKTISSGSIAMDVVTAQNGNITIGRT